MRNAEKIDSRSLAHVPTTWKLVKRKRDPAVRDIDFHDTIDRFAQSGQFVEGGAEQPPLPVEVHGWNENNEAGVEGFSPVERSEIPGIVRDQDKVPVNGVSREGPVRPTAHAGTNHVPGFVAGLGRHGHQGRA